MDALTNTSTDNTDAPVSHHELFFGDPNSIPTDSDQTHRVLAVLDANPTIFAYKYNDAKSKIKVVAYVDRGFSEFTIEFIFYGGRHYITLVPHRGRQIDSIVTIRFWGKLKSFLQAGVDAPLLVFAPEHLMWSDFQITAEMLSTLPPLPTDAKSAIKTLAPIIAMINTDIDDPTTCNGCTILALVTTKPALMDVVLSPSHGVGQSLFKRLHHIITNTVTDVATGELLRFSPETRTFATKRMFELIKQLFTRHDDTVRWMLGELSIVEFVETITKVCVTGDTGPYAKPHTVLHLRRQCGLILDHLVKLRNPIVREGVILRHDWIIDQLRTIHHADHNHQPLTTIVDGVLSLLISESSE